MTNVPIGEQGALQPRFSVFEEAFEDINVPREAAINVGYEVDSYDNVDQDHLVPVSTDVEVLNLHEVAFGMTGSGKTEYIRGRCQALDERGIPFLLFAPIKGHEYDDLDQRCTNLPVITIRPGDPNSLPVKFNPLEPEPGTSIQAHIDMVKTLFVSTSVTSREEGTLYASIIGEALENVYKDCGWDIETGVQQATRTTPPRIPSLKQLHKAVYDVLDNPNPISGRKGGRYDERTREGVRGYMDTRLISYETGPLGSFCETGHPASFREMIKNNHVVIDLSMVNSDTDQGFAIGILLIKLAQTLQADQMLASKARESMGPPGILHATIIDEAHKIVSRSANGGADAYVAKTFSDMFTEIRAYHEGLLLADQDPLAVSDQAVKQAGTKTIFRLSTEEQVNYIAQTMNFDGDEEVQRTRLARIRTAGKGVAEVSMLGVREDMDHPRRIKTILSKILREAPDEKAQPILRSLSSAAYSGDFIPNTIEMSKAKEIAKSMDEASVITWLATEQVVKHMLTNRPLPELPSEVINHIRDLPVRLGECVIAKLIDDAITARAEAIDASGYNPHEYMAAAGIVMRDLVYGRDQEGYIQSGQRLGVEFVPITLQVLHELDKLNPHKMPILPDEAPAPLLDFEIDGVPANSTVRERRNALLNEISLSMKIPGNRWLAHELLEGVGIRPIDYIERLQRLLPGGTPSERVRKFAEKMNNLPSPHYKPSDIEVLATWNWNFVQNFSQEAQSRRDADARFLAQLTTLLPDISLSVTELAAIPLPSRDTLLHDAARKKLLLDAA